MEPVTPAKLEAVALFFGHGIYWVCGHKSFILTSGMKTANAAFLRKFASVLVHSNQDWVQSKLTKAPSLPTHLLLRHAPRQTLSAVRNAADTALAPSGWQRLAWDFAEDSVVATHADHGRLLVDGLSDGIRNMVGLVADIAH